MEDLLAREARVLAALKAGAKVSDDVAKEFVTAKTELKFSVLADTYGGLLGPDALGAETSKREERYERALKAIEEEVL